MIKKIKNNTASDVVYNGQTIHSDEYYQIQPNEDVPWTNCSKLLTDIGNSDAIVNNGTDDITDVSKAINWLKGDPSRNTLDGKDYVYQTSKPLDFMTYFTSKGDVQDDHHKIGGGTDMKIIHDMGDPIEQSLTVDLNVMTNRTFIHEGYVMWEGANFDYVSMMAVPVVTTTSVGSGTNFNTYGDIIIPAAGNGTTVVNPEDMKLVGMPVRLDSGVRPTSFWNADYDSNTHTFSNITAAPTGNGMYNMFVNDNVLSMFVNNMLLLKEGFLKLQTSDSMEIGHNIRLRFCMKTNNSDHVWKAAVALTMHRQNRTILGNFFV